MTRKIKFSLMFRDMFQSYGKYQPTREELLGIAEPIIACGCFDRIETNGGGFEQVTLMRGENPNQVVRDWIKPFHEAGIQTEMLERGLNGIRMYPVPADVRRLFFQVKVRQGVNVFRSFDGLNDPHNVIPSIRYAKAAHGLSQACLSWTYSPIHTADYYMQLAEKWVEAGADEICIKDMAGIGRPPILGAFVKNFKKRHPDVCIEYHTHAGPGLAPASIYATVEAGADMVDVAIAPISWGTGHVDALSTTEILRGMPGIEIPKVDMNAYMEVRSQLQKILDGDLGLFVADANFRMNSLLIAPGLPGGMMGSLMQSLGDSLQATNKWLAKRNREAMTLDAYMVMVFDEVKSVWPQMGYPPLVTPFSQYCYVTALRNVEAVIRGRPRFSQIDEKTFGMLTGKSGALPGALGSALQDVIARQGLQYFTGDPQSLYPDALENFRREMREKGWECGRDDEELMELAMHPEEYRDFKQGKSKQRFEEECRRRKPSKACSSNAQASAPVTASVPVVVKPTTAIVNVDGQEYRVSVMPAGMTDAPPPPSSTSKPAPSRSSTPASSHIQAVIAPVEGLFRPADPPVQIGDHVTEGQVLCAVEAMKVKNDVLAPCTGIVRAILAEAGDTVEEDDTMMRIAAG